MFYLLSVSLSVWPPSNTPSELHKIVNASAKWTAMTSFTAVYEDVSARVTSEVASSKEIPSDDLLRAVRRLAKGHYCGLGGLSSRRPARVTREECAATREEGTRTFQGWNSIAEITPCLAPARIGSYPICSPGLLQDMQYSKLGIHLNLGYHPKTVDRYHQY